MANKKYVIDIRWVEELIFSLSHYYPNQVLLNYLGRFGLPVFGDKDFLIERIRQAMQVSEMLIGNDQIQLRNKYAFPVGKMGKVLITRIGTLLNKKIEVPNFKTLVKYMDDLAFNGHQHIFFYYLNPEFRSYLYNMRNPEFILKLLRKARHGKCFNNNRLIWDANAPKLAEVKHEAANGSGEVRFKWVETRRWFQNIPQTPTQGPQFTPMQERTVNFFKIDLKDGSAEMRLQKLHPNPTITLMQELQIFKTEIGKIIDFSIFSPVPQEPVIRKLLLRHGLQINSWEIHLAGKGKLKGSGDPKLFYKIGLTFKRYKGRRINLEWVGLDRIWGPGNVHAYLDGNTGEFLITRLCDRVQMSAILDWLRGERWKLVTIPEIKNLMKKRKDLRSILRIIDYTFSIEEKETIQVKNLEDLGGRAKRILETFELLSKISKKFIDVDKNGERELKYNKELSRGGILGWLELKIGRRFSEVHEKAVIGLLFMLVFIPLCYFCTWLFLGLLKKATGSTRYLASLSFLINLVLLVALAILVFGKEVIDDAINIVNKICKKILKFFKKEKK